MDNIILMTDSYKVTHYKQYPPNTTKLYSYFESRGGQFDETVFFGLQYILKRYLCGVVVTDEKIRNAKKFYTAHFGNDLFNEKGWTHILVKHGGRLPIRIKAVPEGSVIPTQNVLFTVENTDPEVPWITNWLETILLQCWYSITVATLSRSMKKTILKFMDETTDMETIKEKIPFQLHDFGYRGVSSNESAGIGGAAHLVNFLGTDTLAGISLIDQFYGEPMAGFSVPASEHSTMTAWAALSSDHFKGETDACQHLLNSFPTGILSVVSDSFDIYESCSLIWGQKLKQAVIERAKRGYDKTGKFNKLVIRPDSGDPCVVLPQVLDILYDSFVDDNDCPINSKGFKVLPKYLSIIQGDGIGPQTIAKILQTIKDHNYSIENLVFGSGGNLLQRVHRDTNFIAFKCSYAEIGDRKVNVYKEPKTDPNKKSKKGVLKLTFDQNSHKYCTHEEQQDEKKTVKEVDQLVVVFENGELVKEYKFSEIRDRAKVNINGERL